MQKYFFTCLVPFAFTKNRRLIVACYIVYVFSRAQLVTGTPEADILDFSF